MIRDLLHYLWITPCARLHYFWATFKDSALHSSPYLARVFLTFALLLMAFCFANNQNWTELRTLNAHRAIAPQWAWSTAYLVVGLLKLWRLLDPAPRVIAGILINGAACLLFSASSLLLWASGSPLGALGAYAALNAFWVTVRTGSTNLDRQRA